MPTLASLGKDSRISAFYNNNNKLLKLNVQQFKYNHCSYKLLYENLKLNWHLQFEKILTLQTTVNTT